MCGIVGLIGNWAPELLGQLNQSLYHRGPDDGGEFCDRDAGVLLAMRRLSILDLEGGHQPMSNHDGSLWIVFNGEIYNTPELRARLEAKGYPFKTSHSDTECLLYLYAERGEAMLSELNGMFAFVIYDRERQRVFGARDRFGIKPLYYVQTGAGLALASELKTLLQVPGVQRQLNFQSFYHYLSLRYVPGDESIFSGVYRLPPAHRFIYDLPSKTIDIQRYWQPDFSQSEQHSVDEWSEIIRHELKLAVKRWMLSDVPVGCSVSGGIDSTAIVGLLAEAGYSLSTYSLGFQDNAESAWNELPLARQVADRWGTQHHELVLSPDDLLKDLVRMVWMLDEPYGGGLPSWYIFQFMSRDVKVGLTGTGGDELFGNYGKWCNYENSQTIAQKPLAQKLPYYLKQTTARLPEPLLGADRKRRWHEQYGSNFEMDAYPLYFRDTTKRRFLARTDGVVDTVDWLQALYHSVDAGSVRNGFASVDLQTQLPEEFLLMTDRFSMAHSLEARVPFLDSVFVERMLQIPAPIRTRPDNLKYLLKRAVAPVLPADLQTAPKRGFVIPDTLWLRGKLRPLVEKLLSPTRLARQGLFLPQVYPRFVQPHLDGKVDYTGQVWTLLMFQLWHVVFIEQESVEQPTFTWGDLLQ
jgi:asparagine synthase (glutamine-hydrolysing)